MGGRVAPRLEKLVHDRLLLRRRADQVEHEFRRVSGLHGGVAAAGEVVRHAGGGAEVGGAALGQDESLGEVRVDLKQEEIRWVYRSKNMYMYIYIYIVK